MFDYHRENISSTCSFWKLTGKTFFNYLVRGMTTVLSHVKGPQALFFFTFFKVYLQKCRLKCVYAASNSSRLHANYLQLQVNLLEVAGVFLVNLHAISCNFILDGMQNFLLLQAKTHAGKKYSQLASFLNRVCGYFCLHVTEEIASVPHVNLPVSCWLLQANIPATVGKSHVFLRKVLSAQTQLNLWVCRYFCTRQF